MKEWITHVMHYRHSKCICHLGWANKKALPMNKKNLGYYLPIWPMLDCLFKPSQGLLDGLLSCDTS